MVTNITKMLLIQMPMALKDPADELQVQFQKHWLYSSHRIASAANAAGSQAHLQVINCIDIFFFNAFHE